MSEVLFMLSYILKNAHVPEYSDGRKEGKRDGRKEGRRMERKERRRERKR